MFYDRSLLGRCFLGFVLPVVEYCSAVWCSAADTHLKLPDRAVIGTWFLTEGVFECGIAHRRSVAILCILCKIRCKPVALLIVDPWQYCVCCVRSGVSTLLMVLYLDRVSASAGYTRCSGRTSVHLCASSLQNLTVPQDLYSPHSVPLERSCQPCIRWCGTVGFQEQGQCFFFGRGCSISTIVFYSFTFLFFLSIGLYCAAGVFGLIGCISHSLSLALPTFFNNNYNNTVCLCLCCRQAC